MAPQDKHMSNPDGRRFQYFSSWYRRYGDGELHVAMIGGHYRMEAGLYRFRQTRGGWRIMIFHDAVELESAAGTRLQAPPESLVVWSTTAAPRAYGSPHRRWSHSWISCAGARIDAVMAEAGLPALVPVPLPTPAIADRTLLGLHRELTANARPDPGIQEAFLRLLLLEARRSHRGQGAAADPEGLLWVRRRLDERLDRPASLEELARERGMSARHLARRFAATWGLTPAAYHLRARMDHARSLLDQPGASLAHIARTIGYADAFAFSKAFKQHVGLSPDAYRGRR